MKSRRLFFVTRMYTGLFESLAENRWKPTGIPTITKLAEAAAKRFDFTWVVLCKTPQEAKIVKDAGACFNFGQIKIYVRPFKRYTPVGRINNFLNDMMGFWFLLKLGRGDKKTFYCDRSNIVVAALLRLLTSSPVIIRLLGLYPDQKALAKTVRAKLKSPLIYLAYKIRYTLAVCTQDGSGIEFYLHTLLNSRTRRTLLLNGVKMDTPIKQSRQDGKIFLLFVGKLITDKGILELIDAVTELRERQDNFLLKIVGKGELEPEIRRRISTRGLGGHVQLVGSVKQEAIHHFYSETDVYISLNKLGNLSNTVLEAMAMQKCILMLEKDEATFTDVYTASAVPLDTAVRVSRKHTSRDLAEKLNGLLEDPEKIDGYAGRMAVFSRSFLWTWDERIGYELEKIGQKKL